MRFLNKQDGVITCFLSLILLMILALISVSLESARVAGARFLMESYTKMARNSVMAEYNGALFDRYHIFAYNSRAGTKEGITRSLEAQTAYYIERNLQAENRMLWTPELKEVTVDEYVKLTDKNGAVFRTEAVQYMKYRGVSLVVETLLSSLGLFQGAQETTKLLETKAVTEEALAEIDRGVLKLFESVDGFVRDETGIKENIWGKVKVRKHFAKRILMAVPTPESTQINNTVLFDAIREQYINPQDLFREMRDALTEYESVQENLRIIAQRLEEIGKENFLLHPKLKLERAVLEADRVLNLGRAEVARQSYFGKLHDWKNIVSGCEQSGKKALACLEIIRGKQRLAESKVLQYEDELLAAIKWLDSSLYEDLAEELKAMKQYVGLETEGKERIIDIEKMQETLQKNEKVLQQVLSIAGDDKSAETGLLANERDRVSQMEDALSTYSHDGLRFDYSGLQLKAEGGSPVESFKELLLSGAAALVLENPADVSTGKIAGEELPSAEWIKGSETEDGLAWAEKADSGIADSLKIMNENSPFAGVGQWLGKEGEELWNKTLFLSYLEVHFADFVHASEKESVLAYEQEYILCGNAEDERNLNTVIGKILLTRVIFNLIHVLSDARKCNVAGETAMGLLGVTGLPILVNIMKYLILFVWAAEGALVETAAILQGKKLGLVPTAHEFTIRFSELLLMSREKIIEKAGERKEKDGLAFGYSEYLMLFLLLQEEEVQTVRALDLIQENIALEEEGFLVRQQVCSFSAEAVYILPELFTGFSFFKKRTGGYEL